MNKLYLAEQKYADPRYRWIILGVFILLILFHALTVFGGFYSDDDAIYAGYAADIAFNNGPSVPTISHFQLRWTTIYFNAFFYKVFGVNEFSSVLYSTACYCVTGLFIHKILKTKSLALYIMALALLFFSKSVLINMHRTLGDAALCMAAFAMYYYYRTSLLIKIRPAKYALCFSLAFVFAVMTKETIVLLLPVFAIWLLIDFYRRENTRFWKYALLFSGTLIFIYLLYFKITNGDFFYRYQVLLNNSYLNECSYDQLPMEDTLKRISYQLWHTFLLNGEFSIFIPAITAFFYRKRLNRNPLEQRDILSFMLLLLAANFSSISPFSYIPMCQAWRHFIYLVPFAAIVSAPMIRDYCKDPRSFVLLPVFYIVATGLMLVAGGGYNTYVYLLCAIFFTLVFFSGNKKGMYPGFYTAVFVIIFFSNFWFAFIKPTFPYHTAHKRIVLANFASKKVPTTVFASDYITAEVSRFYLKFDTGVVNFYPIDSFETKRAGEHYLLINSNSSNNLLRRADSLWRTGRFRGVQQLAGESGIHLFRVNDLFMEKIRGDRQNP